MPVQFGSQKAQGSVDVETKESGVKVDEASEAVDMEGEGFPSMAAPQFAEVSGSIGHTVNLQDFNSFRATVGFRIPVPLQGNESDDQLFARMSAMQDKAVAWAETKLGAVIQDNLASMGKA